MLLYYEEVQILGGNCIDNCVVCFYDIFVSSEWRGNCESKRALDAFVLVSGSRADRDREQMDEKWRACVLFHGIDSTGDDGAAACEVTCMDGRCIGMCVVLFR